MKAAISSALKIVGIVLVVLSVAMLPPVLVCIYYGELHTAAGFGHAMWNGLIVGAALYLLFRNFGRSFRVRDGYLIIAMCWIAASIFGAFPYVYADVLANPIDAFFESASGFSTTGATVFADVEAVPRGMLMWRSMTSWFGALGILVFAVALMPSLGINGVGVAEYTKPTVTIDVLSPRAKRVAFGITTGYMLLTFAEALLLKLGGLSAFDSFIHALSTVSTGGFSNYNDGIMHFDSLYVRIIILIFMIICGMSFTTFYAATRRGLKVFREDTEVKAYFTIMIIAVFIVFAGVYFIETGWTHSGEAVNSAFQVVSILTTTGFVSDNLSLWPAFCQMVLVLLMIIGGCSSSSSSGNKVIRLVVVFKLMLHGIQTRLHSNVIRPVRINGMDVPTTTVSAASNHMFLYMLMIFIGAFAMSQDSAGLMDCFTTTISFLGNVGPCFHSTGAGSGFTDYNIFTRFFMSLVMIAGRLELYTILVLFTPGFWRSE